MGNCSSSIRKGGFDPPMCSLLSVGQTFGGTQRSFLRKMELWTIDVRILGCDINHGYLCGTLGANNVLNGYFPVITFWEGEILDGKNYTFITGKWGAALKDDVKHWSKFPAFSPFAGTLGQNGGKGVDMKDCPYIFMRWKEQYIMNVHSDCEVTIDGFYYVCFSCIDGSINGFYYDRSSTPFQKLELKANCKWLPGFCFSSYVLE